MTSKLSQYILDLRAKLGITQQQFSDITGTAKTHVSDIEHGRKRMSIKKGHDIAIAFEQDPIPLMELLLQDMLDSEGLPFSVKLTERD